MSVTAAHRPAGVSRHAALPLLGPIFAALMRPDRVDPILTGASLELTGEDPAEIEGDTTA